MPLREITRSAHILRLITGPICRAVSARLILAARRRSANWINHCANCTLVVTIVWWRVCE